MGRVSSRIQDDIETLLEELADTKSEVVRNGVRRELRYRIVQEGMTLDELADDLNMDDEEFEELTEELQMEPVADLVAEQQAPDEDATPDTATEARENGSGGGDDLTRLSDADLSPADARQLLDELGIEVQPIGPLGMAIPRGRVEFRRQGEETP